jgi:hypothetical protein
VVELSFDPHNAGLKSRRAGWQKSGKAFPMIWSTPWLRAGDEVEVKSADEILATLDASGCLDGMPFMPEMLRFCGQKLRVAKVAHKTCDTILQSGARSVGACVHLEDSRCDGSGHGGCQARCNLFWKEAWLRHPRAQPAVATSPDARCSEATLAQVSVRDVAEGRRYRCQATQLLEASKALAWWDPRQYVRDVTSGNASLLTVVRVLTLSWFAAWRRFGYPYSLSRWAYNRVHRLLFRREGPYEPASSIDSAQHGLAQGAMGLMPGERVRIKSHATICLTLKNGKHRGLWFDAEMVPFCGHEFTVAGMVQKIINERTGEMMQMKGPCIMLDGVFCRAEYSDRRLLCPRAIPPYWREIWLDRVDGGAGADAGTALNKLPQE